MNKKERGEHIIECAKLLFVKKGFHNTTVSDIISESGIARSTFYAHFDNKFDIFKLLLDSYSEILQSAILDINISRATQGIPLNRQVREMTLPLLNAINNNRDLTSLLITAPLGHDNTFDNYVSDFFHKILRAIRQLLNEGIEGKTIRKLDPNPIAYVILGSAKQILLQWLVYSDIKDIYGVVDDIIKYNLFGMAIQ